MLTILSGEETKARIAAGEYEGRFAKFLTQECNNLSSSRAYELIAIANGTKTVEDIREARRERDQNYRDRKAEEAVRRPTETPAPQPNQRLTSENPPKPNRGGRPASAKTQQERLTAQITRACKGLSVEQLETVAALAVAPPCGPVPLPAGHPGRTAELGGA